MTAYRRAVLEHFRHPKNRGTLDDANGEADGANPLCGDRIRVQLRVGDGIIAEARFVADACALCIASASLLTEHVRGMKLHDAMRLEVSWIHAALEGVPPPARERCALLPLETLRLAARATGAHNDTPRSDGSP